MEIYFEKEENGMIRYNQKEGALEFIKSLVITSLCVTIPIAAGVAGYALIWMHDAGVDYSSYLWLGISLVIFPAIVLIAIVLQERSRGNISDNDASWIIFFPLITAFAAGVVGMMIGHFYIEDYNEQIVHEKTIEGEIYKVITGYDDGKIIFKDGRVIKARVTVDDKEILLKGQYAVITIGKKRNGQQVILEVEYPQGIK